MLKENPLKKKLRWLCREGSWAKKLSWERMEERKEILIVGVIALENYSRSAVITQQRE